MKNRLVKSISSCILLLCLTFVMLSCGGRPQGNSGSNNDLKEGSTKFTAQVGYNWTLPTPNNISNYTVTVKENKLDGQQLEVNENQVFFSEIGEYIITYSNSNKEVIANVKAVDTEKPRFAKFWEGEWKYHVSIGESITIKGAIGDVIDMDDYFRAVDNSGKVEVSYEVLCGGVDEVTLSEDNTFVIESADFYWLKATAKDASNNYTSVKYTLQVRQPTPLNSYTNKTGRVQWGAIRFDTTGFNVGDTVQVKFKVKTDNAQIYSLLCYINELGSVAINPTGGFNIFHTYTDWVEIVINAQVTTGLTVRNAVQNNWSDGKNYMPNCPINDLEEGVFFVILNQNNGSSVWTKDVEITLLSNV